VESSDAAQRITVKMRRFFNKWIGFIGPQDIRVFSFFPKFSGALLDFAKLGRLAIGFV
jgi:hypothetical protein